MIHQNIVRILHSINDLNVLKITGEDEKRGQMYAQERKRIDMTKIIY